MWTFESRRVCIAVLRLVLLHYKCQYSFHDLTFSVSLNPLTVILALTSHLHFPKFDSSMFKSPFLTTVNLNYTPSFKFSLYTMQKPILNKK